MTSKTFKSALNPTELEVGTYTDSQVVLAIGYEDGEDLGVLYLAPSDAPALALTILEAAGYTEHDRDGSTLSHFAIAKTNLRMGIHRRELEAAEAKAQAELEAEALELLNAERGALGVDLVRDLSEVHAIAQEAAIAVARRARELAAAQPVVKSVEEADNLPVGSVIILRNGTARMRTDWSSGWASSKAGDDYPTDDRGCFPARVLYRPGVNDA